MSDPTIFEYQIQDDQGLKNRVAIYEAYDGATTTVDSLIGSWLQAGGLIDPCIDGEIVQGQITIPLEKDASWKAAPVSPGNNVNQVMVINFENDFDRYLTELLLPSYKESTLVSKVPNVGANPLLALINYMIAGDVDIFPQSRGSRDLDALRNAFLTVRKVRNQKSQTIVVP